MLQFERHRRLVAYLIDHGLRASPVELAGHLGVSTRTLRSDVARVSRELGPYGARICPVHGQGYVLRVDREGMERLREDLRAEPLVSLETTESRVRCLEVSLLLAHDYLSREALAEQVCVSSATVASYIRQVRDELEEGGLELRTRHNLGYRVAGPEAARRERLFELLAPENGREALSYGGLRGLALGSERLRQVTLALQAYFTSHDIHLDDLALGLFATRMAIGCRRAQEGHAAGPVDAGELPVDRFESLFSSLEKATGVGLDEDERASMVAHLLRSTAFPFESSEDRRYAQLLTTRIIDIVERLYHFDLHGDARLRHDLETHLCQMISSGRYAHGERNPLLATIRKRYVLAYEIAGTSLARATTDLPFSLNEDETGYVALHIGAALERAGKDGAPEPRRIAVLYGGKYAEGAFVASELVGRLGDRLQVELVRPSNEAQRVDKLGVDLIVSTVPVPNELRTPWVLVDISFDQASMERVARALDESGSDPMRVLRAFFDERAFLRMDAENKDDVIRALCAAMRDCGHVDDDFERSVFEREARIPTSMDDVIALPHPMEAKLASSKVGVAILERPIIWSSDHTAQVVFLLGLSSNTEATTVLYDALVLVAYDHRLERDLTRSRSLDEFLDLMCAVVTD